MPHAFYRVTTVESAGPHMLRIGFDDGSSRTINFSPVLAGSLFGPLRDPRLFAQVAIDPEAHTLVWPNGADFDPETLHDWPRFEPALVALAERWAAVPTA